MITEEEWQKLKIGHVIYVVYDSNDVQLIKTTISKSQKHKSTNKVRMRQAFLCSDL